jgi:transposase
MVVHDRREAPLTEDRRNVVENGAENCVRRVRISGPVCAVGDELREAVRSAGSQIKSRAKLVGLHSGLKAQVHAVLAKQGVHVPMTDLFGVGGQRLLDGLRLDPAYNARVVSLRRLIDALDFEIDIVAKRTATKLAGHPGYLAVRAIDGVGPVFAAIFVAEIGDVTRFTRPQQLCSWAGLTPRHRESDTTVHRGRITNRCDGSRGCS